VPISVPSATIATRAVAQIINLGGNDTPCLMALNQTASRAVSVIGSSSVNMPGCSIAAMSTQSDAIYMQGGNGASIIANTLISPGGFDHTGSTLPTLTKRAELGAAAPAIINPYTSTLTHAALTAGIAACTTVNVPPPRGATTPYSANSRFCNGLVFPNGNNTVVDLSPGTYWVTDGDLSIGSNGTLECTACNGGSQGVTIIFTAVTSSNIGALTMQSNSAVLNLNAPNSGPFAGVLFAQDTVAGAHYTASGLLQGGPGINFVGTGLVYFPNTTMTFQGNPSGGASGCLILIADKVQLQGNSNVLAAAGCSSAGLPNTPTIRTVSLAE